MLDKRITTILFDLDGTLLPMDTDAFTKAYFRELTKKAAEHGYTDSKALIAAVWAGTKAMVQNDGRVSNFQRFWSVFAGQLGEKALELKPCFDSFYAQEFHRVKSDVGENPLAKPLVEGLKAKGYDVILATNPIFPLVGQATRLSWVGLKPENFSLVTSYENSSFCKPNPAYFGEILKKTGKRPEECLMVGNDADEDLAAAQAGLEVYLVTDCLINKSGRDLSGVKHSSFREFFDFTEVQ